MILIEQLRFRYPGGTFDLTVQHLDVAAGATVAVIGPSGSGKTTLLHLIAGISVPASGRITVAGVEPATLSETARRAFRIQRIGLVFQDFALIEYLDVLDNILLPVRITPVLRLDSPVRERAIELAKQLGLGDKLRRNVGRLSQGEKQRVAVCRALLPKPSVLLADEPTGNLDPTTKGQVLDTLLDCAKKTGATLVTVTHDHDLLGRFARVIDFAELATFATAPLLDQGGGPA